MVACRVPQRLILNIKHVIIYINYIGNRMVSRISKFADENKICFHISKENKYTENIKRYLSVNE